MVNCVICCNVEVSGFVCKCKGEICIKCEVSLQKCPFCRRAYPTLLARLSKSRSLERALEAVQENLNRKLETDLEVLTKAQTLITNLIHAEPENIQSMLESIGEEDYMVAVRTCEEVLYDLVELAERCVSNGEVNAVNEWSDHVWELLVLLHPFEERVQDILQDMNARVEKDNKKWLKEKFSQRIYKKNNMNRRHMKIRNIRHRK